MRADLGKFKASIGSTDACLGGEYLIDDDLATHTLNHDDMSELDSDEDEDRRDLDNLDESVTQGEIDLDALMVSATHAGKSKGVDPAHLSKIWKKDLKTAERTLDVVSQNNKRVDDPKLLKNYSVPMTGCCDTSRSQSISSWIHSLPPRRLASRHEVTPAASYLLPTRDSYMLFP